MKLILEIQFYTKSNIGKIILYFSTKFKIQIASLFLEIKNKIYYGYIGLTEIVWGSKSNLTFVHGLSGQNRLRG